VEGTEQEEGNERSTSQIRLGVATAKRRHKVNIESNNHRKGFRQSKRKQSGKKGTGQSFMTWYRLRTEKIQKGKAETRS